MTMAAWPQQDQPREKLLLSGPKTLSDTELLATFLRTGMRGKSALALARELIITFGSLKNVLSADLKQLLNIKGIGRTKYIMLQTVCELSKRYHAEPLPEQTFLHNTQLTQRFLIQRLQDYTQEVFACIFLDIHNRLIIFKELFFGTLSETSIYPREVIKAALQYNAAKIIFSHNHPSGNPEPSDADIQTTYMLKEALSLIGLEVIDHIVVGFNNAVSLAERGLL